MAVVPGLAKKQCSPDAWMDGHEELKAGIWAINIVRRHI